MKNFLKPFQYYYKQNHWSIRSDIRKNSEGKKTFVKLQKILSLKLSASGLTNYATLDCSHFLYVTLHLLYKAKNFQANYPDYDFISKGRQVKKKTKGNKTNSKIPI